MAAAICDQNGSVGSWQSLSCNAQHWKMLKEISSAILEDTHYFVASARSAN